MFASEKVWDLAQGPKSTRRGEQGLTHSVLGPRIPFPAPTPGSSGLLPSLSPSHPQPVLVRQIQGRPGATKEDSQHLWSQERGWDGVTQGIRMATAALPASLEQRTEDPLGRPALFGLGGLAPEANS